MTTVHVIDDDLEFRTAIGRLLRVAGYEVALYELGGATACSSAKRG